MNKNEQNKTIFSDARSKYGLYAICLGFFLVLIDTTALNVAVPSLRIDFAGNIAQFQWVVNSYTLVFASLLVASGAMGDRFGARLFYQTGLVLFTGMSLMCALSPGIEILISARVLQGLGAAIMLPASLALLSHAFPDPEKKGRAVAFWAVMVSLGFAIGPALGGVLTSCFGWRSVFWINVPIGMVAVAMVSVFVDEAKVENPRRLDWAGQVSACLFLFFLTYGLIEAGNSGWTAPRILWAFTLSVLSAFAFLFFERKSPSPVLPQSLFSNRIFSICISIGFLLNFCMYGIMFIESIYLENTRHVSAILTGFIIFPFTGLGTTTVQLLARFSGPQYLRPRLAFGQLISALGGAIFCLSIWTSGYWAILLGFGFLGVGIGCIMPPMTAGILTASGTQTSGLASGILNSARQVGGTLGVALLGTLVQRLSEQGYLMSFVLTFVLFLVMALISWFSLPVDGLLHSPFQRIRDLETVVNKATLETHEL